MSQYLADDNGDELYAATEFEPECIVIPEFDDVQEVVEIEIPHSSESVCKTPSPPPAQRIDKYATIISILERIESKVDALDARLQCNETKQIKYDEEVSVLKGQISQIEEAVSDDYFSPELYSSSPIKDSHGKPTLKRIKLPEKKIKLPCRTMEELAYMEKEIEENGGAYTCVFQYLQKLRTHDHSKFIRKCLGHIFDDKLACSFNWSGKGDRNKKPASELKVISLIKQLVMQFFTNCSNTEMQNHIQRWFRYSDQRMRSKQNTVRDKVLKTYFNEATHESGEF